MNDDCDHRWQFQGGVYSFDEYRPGSSAQERVIEDRYFCEKCLEVRHRNKRYAGTSYDKPIIGTLPK